MSSARRSRATLDATTRSDGSIPPVSQQPTAQRFFIVGGAGFIGSHFCDRLLAPDGGAAGVTLYDNFSSGREWHVAHHAGDARLRIVRGERRRHRRAGGGDGGP